MDLKVESQEGHPSMVDHWPLATGGHCLIIKLGWCQQMEAK